MVTKIRSTLGPQKTVPDLNIVAGSLRNNKYKEHSCTLLLFLQAPKKSLYSCINPLTAHSPTVSSNQPVSHIRGSLTRFEAYPLKAWIRFCVLARSPPSNPPSPLSPCPPTLALGVKQDLGICCPPLLWHRLPRECVACIKYMGLSVYVRRVWARPPNLHLNKLLWRVFQWFFGIGHPMNADFLEHSAGVYGVQNMHLFKLRCSDVFSFWQNRKTR